jgi:predicted  nucleic acid-binding Zn-ribbon protein
VKVLLLMAGIVAVGGAVMVAVRPPSAQEQLRTLRTELRALKDSAEACSTALAQDQEQFGRYQAHVDSLRDRIDALEDIIPDGVPGDSYPQYLATVDSFNAAVPDWQPTADSLASSRRACEARIEAHRMLADSVRRLAASLGLLDPPPDSGSR